MTTEMYGKILPIPGPNGKELRKEIKRGLLKRGYLVLKLIPREKSYLEQIAEFILSLFI